MGENTCKFEIKINPLDLHVGLKDNMAEFESLIRMPRPGVSIAEKIEKDLKSRYCHCCFFGHVKGELMGEPLCEECARALYGFDENEEHPSIKKIDPYYQLWYRRKKALPIFEAYLHSEVERYKLELKLEDAKATAYVESVDAGMRERRLKRALWLAREQTAIEKHNHFALCHNHSTDLYLCINGASIPTERSTTMRLSSEWSMIWKRVVAKCRAKAEEYK